MSLDTIIHYLDRMQDGDRLHIQGSTRIELTNQHPYSSFTTIQRRSQSDRTWVRHQESNIYIGLEGRTKQINLPPQTVQDYYKENTTVTLQTDTGTWKIQPEAINASPSVWHRTPVDALIDSLHNDAVRSHYQLTGINNIETMTYLK